MLGCVEATTMNLNRLLNADGATVGYFIDDTAGRAAMQAARAEWDSFYRGISEGAVWQCSSVATPIKPLRLEDVEPGDGDRVDYVYQAAAWAQLANGLGNTERPGAWLARGATDVIAQRHEINRYRRPGKSNRSADLGGPEQAAGVLYVLTIKAPIVQGLCK